MYKYLKVHNIDISKDPKESFKFDFINELSKAEKDGEENSTNNIYGIHNDYYEKYIKDHMEELKNYFNLTLESFRNKYDSDFLTTFMYSENAKYVRKFIGLNYTRKLIQTFKI